MKAILRRVSYAILAPLGQIEEGTYRDSVPGYQGYVRTRGHWCLAFRRNDGSLQFSW